MSRFLVAGIAAVLLSCGAYSRVATAQSPPPASAPADDATPISCIVYMEYEGPTGAGSDTIASNDDIAGSATALSRKLPGEAPLVKVDHHITIDDALRSFLEPKNGKRSKCCKRIDILGHGSSLGELELPRTHPDDAPEQAGIEKIGGSQAYVANLKTDYPKKEQTRLLEFIASLKAAACPDPTVHFQACYTVQGGSSGIATEIANFGGMKTTGYTGQCDFPREDKPEGNGYIWSPPQASTGSTEVTTEPPKDEKKEEKKEVKKEEKKVPVKKSETNQKKKGFRQVQTPSNQGHASKKSSEGISPDAAQTLGTAVGIGVGIGMGGGRRGDDGGRAMRDR